MPFYKKIDVTFIEIPANAGTAINYSLLTKEFNIKDKSYKEQRKLLFDVNFKRNSPYDIMPWWKITQIYPQSINSKNIFSIVRNPFDRMVTIFFNFTKFKYEYFNYRPSSSDSVLDLREKFEAFIKEYHMWRNMSAGAGLNIIEIISRRSPEISKNMYLENSHGLNNYYYYDQAYILNKDFQKNLSIFSKEINKKCEIIKYENLDLLYEKYPKIFDRELYYENFDSRLDFYMANIDKLPYKYYYNKFTKKFVQEHFEIDFYNFHYGLDL
jgi:hypothetical protein